MNGQLQLQVLFLRALMHVIADDPEIVNIGKPSILKHFLPQNNGPMHTNSPSSSMAGHRLLPGKARDRLQPSKSTTISIEDGIRPVDPLKHRLKPRKTSSDSESVEGSESDSIASDTDNTMSSDNQSEESSERIRDGGEEDLGVRVNIRSQNCCEHQVIEQECSQTRKPLSKPQRMKPPRSPSAH